MSVKRILLDMAAAHHGATPMVLGIAGPQGSGKSTLAAQLAAAVPGAAVLSLDDLYLGHETRRRLACDVHPLLATRGVPGTHDVDLGITTIAALRRGDAVRLPRFEKSIDDRVPDKQWPLAGPARPLIVVEGWCLGAPAMPEPLLVDPVNTLEAEEDRDGVWRRWVNRQLALAYTALWQSIDALLWLAPPSFETVVQWRQQQEAALRRTAPQGTAVMDEAAVVRFVAHYERITRWMMEQMRERGDRTIHLDVGRRMVPV